MGEALPRPQHDPAEFRCRNPRCRRYLGRVVDGILVEPNGDRSALPCIRKCRRCKTVNTRLA